MTKFDPSEYEMVKDRLKRYGEEYTDFRVETEIVTATDNLDDVVIKATLYKNKEDQLDGTPHSTGLAEELRDAGFINKTSHVENAETSAIGRALANINYHGTDKRPSAEEMDKVKRTKKAKNKKTEEKPTPENPIEDTGEKNDEILEKINSFDKMSDLVKYFNEELDKDKKSEYKQVTQDRIKELKE